MRRTDRAISNEEARSLFESTEYGLLSMSGSDGVPYASLSFRATGDESAALGYW